MSARFGRNKRRRAREAIAAAQHESTLLRMLVDAERAAHRRTEDRLLAREREIELAKAIAGPASILFPATRTHEHTELTPPDSIYAATEAAFRWHQLTSNSSLRSMRLNTLVARVNRDWLEQNVHLRLTFDGIPIAYAVGRDTVDRIPEAALCATIMREAVPLMAQALADELVRRRQPKPGLSDPSMDFRPGRPRYG